MSFFKMKAINTLQTLGFFKKRPFWRLKPLIGVKKIYRISNIYKKTKL